MSKYALEAVHHPHILLIRLTPPNPIKMRQKRTKAYRKLMQLYCMSFGFRQPYQVLGIVLQTDSSLS